MTTDVGAHLSEDLLAAVALGDDLPGGRGVHLATCTRCRLTVSEMLAVITVAQDDAGAEHDLDHPAPPSQVWATIAAAIADPTVVPLAAGVRASRPGEQHRGSRRHRGPLLMVAAAMVGLLVGGGIVAAADAWRSDPTVVASASLTPVPGGPTNGQSGMARIERAADGQVLAVSTSNLTAATGYYEVWLLNPTSGGMIAMGVVPDGTGTATLPVPPGVDLTQYAAVDISDEPLDGNPGHSSVSVLRGELAT